LHAGFAEHYEVVMPDGVAIPGVAMEKPIDP
jgi:hypothetical protein